MDLSVLYRAEKNGITILNELGLDPGIDHLLAMRFFDKAREEGRNVTSFISWCGGLPAPEVSDNPLGYKFSWSPRGVLTAALNPAKYLKDERIVELPSILNASQTVPILKGFNFEGVPNRDSLKYIQIYQLDKAHLKTMFRGTLRYQGYTEIIRCFRDLGLMDVKPSLLKDTENLNWGLLIDSLLKESINSKEERKEAISRTLKLDDQASQRILDAFDWLGLLDESQKVEFLKKSPSNLDALCSLLEKKLRYGPNERDLICLHHIFETTDSNMVQVSLIFGVLRIIFY